MKKISIVFVAALSLAAFGCTESAVGVKGEGRVIEDRDRHHAQGADCGKAVDNGMEVQKADLPTGMDDKLKGKMKDVAMSHCKDDKWSDDVVQCMSEAKTGTDFKTCQGKMTPEQKGGMQKAMKDLMAAADFAAEHP